MSAALTRLGQRVANRTVTSLSTRPALYYGVRAITGSMDGLCIRRDTELVIEGYPRSANSTTVHGFLERQDRPVRVAHHKHHAAQLIRAVRWGIPALALIRDPRGAILSRLALSQEACRRTGRTGRGAALGFRDAAVAWEAFYRAILPHGDRLLIVPFERATADLDGVIDDLNRRFGTSYRSLPGVRSPQPELGWHAQSNPLRREIKAELAEKFERELRQSLRLAALLDACNAVHRRVLGLA